MITNRDLIRDCRVGTFKVLVGWKWEQDKYSRPLQRGIRRATLRITLKILLATDYSLELMNVQEESLVIAIDIIRSGEFGNLV